MAKNNYGLAGGIGRPLMTRSGEQGMIDTAPPPETKVKAPNSGWFWREDKDGKLWAYPVSAWEAGMSFWDWLARSRPRRPKSTRPKPPARLPVIKPAGDGSSDDSLETVPNTDTGLYVDPAIANDQLTEVRPPGQTGLSDYNPYVPPSVGGSGEMGPPVGGDKGPVGGYQSMTDQAWKCMKEPNRPECQLQGSQRRVI